ncbi:MAG: sigma-54-dependent Fis family transcriptional regulator, partial [Nitrospira sp.]|nr:sigma-54-dependent Fis family transcriptional regulator [Nitrospira sp.]
EQEAIRRECEQLGIITRNPTILGMFRDLKKGARSTVTVLITGEPGTGKELFARAVHRLSPRTAKSFIAVNMAAISPELFESELFGHVRGSFTGALTDRKGYFELAHQGTIFLDEIGDLRLDHQSKLLRVLQDRTFYRVGATSPTTVDVRIVAATNKDLQRGVSEGWFREDLYFRLKGLLLHLPPLRDRIDDIPALADACLQEAAKQAHQESLQLSEEALETLRQQPWKGNVRELRHSLEQAVALSDGPIIMTADLRLQRQPSPFAARADAEIVLPDPAGDVAVLHHLRQYRFDMQATAQALGWDRSTVTQRLKGLCFQALVESKGDQTKAASALAGDSTLLRTVELKLMDYYGHLIETIQPFSTVEKALLECKRRFKNLPERHFKSVEALVRRHFR